MAEMRIAGQCNRAGPVRVGPCPRKYLTRGDTIRASTTQCAASTSGEQRTYTDQEVEAVLGLPADHVWPYTGPTIEHMQETFNQLPYISVHEGPHGYPVVHMEHPNGSDLTLHLHGGFISSWVDVGKELLFVHPGTDFKPSRPLTGGGVRPAFPHYGYGVSGMPYKTAIPANGFLTSQHFDLLSTLVMDPVAADPEPTVSLLLESNDVTRAVFPHDFRLAYHVTLMDADDDDHIAVEPRESAADAAAGAAEEAAAAAAGGAEDEAALAAGGAGARKRGGGAFMTSAGQAAQRIANRPAIAVPPPAKKGRKKVDPEAEAEKEEQARIAKEPSQIRFVWEVTNTGTDAFEFQAATLTDLAVKDLREYAQSVRLVGLRGRYALDWSAGAAKTPEVVQEDMDFTYPTTPVGTRMDRVYCGTDDTDVHFCPGDTTYYKVVFREGFKDTVVAHPDMGEAPWHAGFVTLGAGKVAAPVTLQPGEQWCAEFALRKHRTYWPLPDFETEGTPLPETLGDMNAMTFA